MNYPNVGLDITMTNEIHLDLVAGHFDEGTHLGEFIERGMIAVRVSRDQRAAIVGRRPSSKGILACAVSH